MGTARIDKSKKDLGVIFDSKLTFTPHIDALVANTHEAIWRRFQIRKRNKIKATAVIEYGAIIWPQN